MTHVVDRFKGRFLEYLFDLTRGILSQLIFYHSFGLSRLTIVVFFLAMHVLA